MQSTQSVSINDKQQQIQFEGVNLKLKEPICNWNDQMITMLGGIYGQSEGKRGANIGICLYQNSKINQYTLFDIEGNPFERMIIKKYGDKFLALEVNCRKYEVGTRLLLWSSQQGKYEPCYFKLYTDNYSLGPVGPNCCNLRIGLRKGQTRLFLIQKEDPNIIKLQKTPQLMSLIEKHIKLQKERDAHFEKMKLQNQKIVHLLFQIPSNYKLLSENNRYVIGAFGKEWHTENNGRGCAIKIFQQKSIFEQEQFKKTCFIVDGDLFKHFALRLYWDQDLNLSINYHKLEEGNGLGMWNCNQRKYAPCFFRINPQDRTISPFQRKGKNLCLGLAQSELKIILVKRESNFAIKLMMEGHLSELFKAQHENYTEQLKRNQQLFDQATSKEAIEKIKNEGYIHLKKLVPEKLIQNALRQVNRMIGEYTKKAKKFPQHTQGPNKSDVIDVFNLSAIPEILEAYLGPKTDNKGYFMDEAQIALRFPNDGCYGPMYHTNQWSYQEVKKYWHFDGVPSEDRPGQSDHFGKLHTFDALVGVYLSQVKEKFNGQFCTYSGSHKKLANYLQNEENFKKICEKGEMPYDKSPDQLFQNEPVHLLVEPGDVVIANYINAHFIAPNTGSKIRYALYFRVIGPKYNTQKWKEPALNPLNNWII